MATAGFVNWWCMGRIVLVDGRHSTKNRSRSKQRTSINGVRRATGVEFLVEFDFFQRSTSRLGSSKYCSFSSFNCGDDVLHPATRSLRRQSTDTLSIVGSFRRDAERQHRLVERVISTTKINSLSKNERTRRQMVRCCYEAAWLIDVVADATLSRQFYYSMVVDSHYWFCKSSNRQLHFMLAQNDIGRKGKESCRNRLAVRTLRCG
jgi:hypothetical protein